MALVLIASLVLGSGLPADEPSAVIEGTATWCAPTPRYCQSWGGNAHLGAVPSFRWGDDPYRVQVCRVGTNRCTTVTVVSFCACGTTAIDLSPAAFRELAPLSRGRIPVTVEVGGSFARQTLPPTDMADPWGGLWSRRL